MIRTLSKDQKVKKNDNWLRGNLSKIINTLKYILICILVVVCYIFIEESIVSLYPWIGFIAETLGLTSIIVSITGSLYFYTKVLTHCKYKNIKLYILSGLLMLFLIAVDITVFWTLKDNLSDIPILVSSNYSTITGYPVNVQMSNGKDHHQKFTINKMNFKDKNFVKFSTGKYKITYLPNTKFVLNIEKLSD